MFWGIILKPNTKCKSQVEKAFRVSSACLEFKKPEDSSCVKLLYKDLEFILCYLDGKTTRQVQLDLAFERDEVITFVAEGSGVVHLTGIMEDDEDEESYFDDEDESTTPQLVSKKRKGSEVSPKQDSPGAKRLRKAGGVPEESDEDEEDSDFDPNAMPSDDELGSDEEGSSDDEMGGEEDEEDEEDLELDSDDLESFDEDAELDEEESPSEKASAKNKKDVSQKQKSGDKKPQEQGKKISQTPSQKEVKQNGEGAVNGEAKDSEKKKKKRKKNKNKQKDGQASDGSPAPKSPAAGGADGTKKQPVVDKNGVKIVTLKEGTGPVAKKGKAVHVYYRGRLQSNNKEFDKVVEGKGFQFRLGAGEVIKGWDIGVDGMKVGEKRRITVPGKLGYGAQGMKGVIPPNATLVFDVEMKAVS